MPTEVKEHVLLKNVIAKELAAANHPHVEKFLQRLPDDIDTLEPHVQQVIINRELRFLLTKIEQQNGVDTFNARFCVIDGAPEKEWVRTLRKGPLGLLAQYGMC